MSPRIVGISGSPIKNSNTDRLIKLVLKASGLPGEFIKLHGHTLGACRACLGCVKDNI